MQQSSAILLYNGECAVCCRIAAWAQAPARGKSSLVVMPIGDDPHAIERLHPGLDIWDAYEIVHLLMPDGSMKTGGAAVSEVLRMLPDTKWLAAILDVHVGSFRPGGLLVDAGYTVLAEIRPVLGCASCGSTNAFVQSAQRAIHWLAQRLHANRTPAVPHFRSATWLPPTPGARHA